MRKLCKKIREIVIMRKYAAKFGPHNPPPVGRVVSSKTCLMTKINEGGGQEDLSFFGGGGGGEEGGFRKDI